MGKGFCLLGVAVLGLLTLPGAASATTIGATSFPPGSAPGACFAGDTFAQLTEDPTTPYTVPTTTGSLTQWATNTVGDTPGDSLELVVMTQTSLTGNYQVVGTDTATLPNPLPANHVATFDMATPIAVAPGDILGLYTAGSDTCVWYGANIPARDSVQALSTSSPPPATGDVLAQGFPNSGPNYMADLAATIVQSQDAGVTTSAGPANAAARRPALLSSTVTNDGPAAAPITFTDAVTTGLTVNSATAGDGTCSTAGQTVTCTISNLQPGQSVPIDVVVTPAAAGRYVNGVAVGVGSNTDDDPANNAASATLTVTPPAPSPSCVVPNLKRTSAKLAKTVLKDLDCKVKVIHQHSKRVRKGKVIKTKPGAGRYAPSKTIHLVVSSGRRKKKTTRHAARQAVGAWRS